MVARYWAASGTVARSGDADRPRPTSAEEDSMRLTTVIIRAWLRASSRTFRFIDRLRKGFDPVIVAGHSGGVNDR